ncbi:unnamed protein product [Rhodiola kirilowii]
MAAVETDCDESACVAPSSSSKSLRRDILHTYRRRRLRKAESHDADFQFSHQLTKKKMGPDTEFDNCEQGGFHGLENHATENNPNNYLLGHSKNIVFEDILKGGVGGCLKAAFEYHGQQSCKEECTNTANGLSSEGFLPSSTSRKIDGNTCVQSDGILTTNCCTSTEICQRAFSDIMASGEFSSLCKLLSENFQGVKVEKLFDCSFIDRRIKEGTYEHMPVLFPSDMHQFWKRLEKVGAEIISLARGVSNRSKACCVQFSTQGFDSHDNTNHPGAFAEVGEKSDGKEFLICQMCQDMYHFPCIEPALKEISSRNGYCAKCIADGTKLPHENCAVCKKLHSPAILTNGDCDKLIDTDEEMSTDHEESSNSDIEERMCKLCSIEIGSNEKYQVCGHKFCQGRYYHERCLTVKELKSYASCWYCPSCLCRVCLVNKDDDKIVLCDGCDHGYHIHCLIPPLSSIPRGKWFCAECRAGMAEIARVRKAYMSGIGNRREDNEDCKKADGHSRKKQNTNGKDLSSKSEGMDMLLTAANTLNKEE